MRRGLILSILGALAVAARAEARPRVAILDLVSNGMEPDARQQFETLIEERLHKAGYDIVDYKTVTETIVKRELPEGCTFGPCVAPIARALGADRFLSARIGADGQSYNFVISMLEGHGGAPIAQMVGSCPVCTVAEVLAKVGVSMDALDGQSGPVAPAVPPSEKRPRSSRKAAGAWMLAAGVAAALGGAAIVAWTEHDPPGWVTIGSGGTVALTGLILLVGD